MLNSFGQAFLDMSDSSLSHMPGLMNGIIQHLDQCVDNVELHDLIFSAKQNFVIVWHHMLTCPNCDADIWEKITAHMEAEYLGVE